jgi:hypothetical protein
MCDHSPPVTVKGNRIKHSFFHAVLLMHRFSTVNLSTIALSTVNVIQVSSISPFYYKAVCFRHNTPGHFIWIETRKSMICFLCMMISS